ncbi:MAG: M64 family metallopeptidase [Ignavibacteria bacterium]|nr:M64 family metallopeptidase [Ignavibacteria bacterium]
MKKLFILSFILIAAAVSAQVKFDDYFTGKTMRFDYNRAGNDRGNSIFFEQLKQEPYWSGNKSSLIDPFDYGHYKYEVYDSASGKLIYSRGYNTLFDEWESTEEAKTLDRTFYETVVFPYPKNTVRVELFERKKDGNFGKQFEIYINPSNKFIRKEKPLDYPVTKVVDNGDPTNKVDIVFLPDGYTKDEMDKFMKDVKTYSEYIFGCTPFKENKDKINIWAVQAPSMESGVDNPGENVWKNNILGMSYNSTDVDRYLMTLDVKTVRDLAGLTPYDNICIISNSSKYGGGAIYNDYTSFPNENKNGAYLIVHEFGHHFCALGDEYYTSEVSVEEYYKLDVEPYEPNLTTLVNFDKKWKNMMDKSTPIPTPSTKEYFETLGVFEGGGYIAKGVYRPKQDCTMKTITYDNFCPVCKKAIIGMIKYYSE